MKKRQRRKTAANSRVWLRTRRKAIIKARWSNPGRCLTKSPLIIIKLKMSCSQKSSRKSSRKKRKIHLRVAKSTKNGSWNKRRKRPRKSSPIRPPTRLREWQRRERSILQIIFIRRALNSKTKSSKHAKIRLRNSIPSSYSSTKWLLMTKSGSIADYQGKSQKYR